MNLATFADLDTIKSIFAPYAKAYFPHIRQDYICRKIEANNVIIEDGVVIIFGVYKKKQRFGYSDIDRIKIKLTYLKFEVKTYD